MPRKSHAAAVLADGSVLIIGGSFGGPVPTASTDIFNPATDSVVPGPDMNVARAGHSATILPNGNVLVAGGTDGINELSSVEIYDAATGKFSMADSLTIPRTGHSAFPLPDGGALIIGGTSATSEIYSTGLRLGGTPLIGNTSTPDVVSQLLAGCSAGGSRPRSIQVQPARESSNRLSASSMILPNRATTRAAGPYSMMKIQH